MKRKISTLLCLLLAAVLLTLPALAEGPADAILTDDPVSASGELDRTLYAAGQTVESSALVHGAVLAAGYNVTVGGSGEYIMAAGYNILLTGAAERDIFTAGYSVSLSGAAARDVYLAANDITVTGEIGRDLYAAARNITLTGSVGGDVYLDAESITLGSGVVIDGTLHYNSSADVKTVDNSQIAATEIYEIQSESQPDAPAPKAASPLLGKLLSYLGMVALAFVLLWLTPLWERIDERYTAQPFSKFATAFGIGFGVLLGLPLAAALLMVTRIGLPLAFVLLLLYVAAIIAAPVFLGFFLGSLLWRGAMKKTRNYWVELPLGLLVWKLASLVPVLKFAVGLVTVPLGLGVVALLLGKAKRGGTPGEPAAETAPAAEPPALPPEDFGSFQG